MTLIYSNGLRVTNFKPDPSQPTGYRFGNAATESIQQTLDIVQDVLELDQASNSILPTADLTDIRGLLTCYAELAEDMLWQLKVLDDQNPHLGRYQSKMFQELLFFYTILQCLNRDLQNQINRQTAARLKPWQDSSNAIKLNLGSGQHAIEDWLNVDMFPADLPFNLLWDLPLTDNSVAWVYSCYLLEYLNYPNDALKLLQQIHRVLQPGGVLRLCVTNIKPYMQAYLSNDEQFFQMIEAKQGFSFGDTLLQKVLNCAGAGQKSGTADNRKFGYDAVTLEKLLIDAGFTQVYECQYMNSQHSELRVDHNSWLAENYQDTSLSIIFEAVK